MGRFLSLLLGFIGCQQQIDDFLELSSTTYQSTTVPYHSPEVHDDDGVLLLLAVVRTAVVQ